MAQSKLRTDNRGGMGKGSKVLGIGGGCFVRIEGGERIVLGGEHLKAG